MSSYAYLQLYEQLRRRIVAGEFALGERLPSIAELQREYSVASPGTVRAAQQLLAREGLISTQQGRGAFVRSTGASRAADPLEAIDAAVAELATARQLVAGALRDQLLVDLADVDTRFVLTEALRAWADEQRRNAGGELSLYADTAEQLLDRIEQASSA